MKKKITFVLLFISTVLFSQNDCIETLVVCGNSGYQDLAVTGFGTQELSGSNTCSSQENNSIWFKLIIKTGGTLGFTLTPNSSSINEDFDFFIFGPNVSCNNLGQAIRCSTTNPSSALQGNNLTGMNATESDTSEGPGNLGNSFVKWLNVSDGDSYFLVVDRPIGTSNFSLNWTGTATFSDQPVFQNITTDALNLEQCDTDSILDEKTTFDLTTNTALSIGSQTNIVATYHTSNNDALLGSNPILNTTNFNNTSNPQTIYLRLTNSLTQCFDVTEFELKVKPLVQLNTPVKLTACDPNNNGFYDFDLTQNNTKLVADVSKYNISYFNSETDALNNNLSTIISTLYTNKIAYTSEKIWVRVENTLSGCYNVSSFDIEVYSKPKINSNFTLKQCDEDGIPDGFTNFNLNEANSFFTLGDTSLSVTYFLTSIDANDNLNPINASNFSNATKNIVWARIENTNGCFNVAQLNLLVSATSFLPSYLKKAIVCDDDAIADGFHTFLLSDYSNEIKSQFPTGQHLSVTYYRNLLDAQLETNKIPDTINYLNENPFSQTLYVRVESDDNGACFGLGPHLQLIVNPRPEFELDSTAIYCQNLPPITVKTSNPLGNYTYEWKDSQNNIISTNFDVTISNSGIYTVIATSSDGCESFPKTITVNPSIIASISSNDITIIDDSQNNSITVSPVNLGIGDYEYALDSYNGPFQNQPFFDQISPGIHTIFVKDKNNCGITSLKVSVIGYPKFFTPNNDGINDTWRVLGVSKDFYQNSAIFIFNRFGKLITQIDPKDNGWDGMFNGQFLPASDYWFSVELIDKSGNIKIRKGHFSLIRR